MRMYFNSPSALRIVPLTETPTHSWQKPAETHTHTSNSVTSLFFLPLSLTHSLFFSHIFLDWGFSTCENTNCCHKDGHESWQGPALAENLHLISLIAWLRAVRGVSERQTDRWKRESEDGVQRGWKEQMKAGWLTVFELWGHPHSREPSFKSAE